MHTTQLLSASRLVFCSLGTVGAVRHQRSGLRSVSISLSFSKSLANHPAAGLVPCLPPGPSPPRCCPGLSPAAPTRPSRAGPRPRGLFRFRFSLRDEPGLSPAQPGFTWHSWTGRHLGTTRLGSARLDHAAVQRGGGQSLGLSIRAVPAGHGPGAGEPAGNAADHLQPGVPRQVRALGQTRASIPSAWPASLVPSSITGVPKLTCLTKALLG